MNAARHIRIGLALALALSAVGCFETYGEGPPAGNAVPATNEWRLAARDLVGHEVRQSRTHRTLELHYLAEIPYSLGETFVTDLVVLVRDPVAGETITLPNDRATATLARAPEEANARTGLLAASGGQITLDAATGDGARAFAGRARLDFIDTMHGNAKYLVVAAWPSLEVAARR